jgi:hypothetical protein
MNNLPDEDAKLINFLRQNQSIAPPEISESEDRLMSKIDELPTQYHQKRLHSWWKYLAGGIGMAIAGVIGVTTFQILNPPEPSIAELDGLNLFLDAHITGLAGDLEMDIGKHEDLADSDDELL